MIMENCQITIPTVHTYKYYSNYRVEIKETCVIRLANWFNKIYLVYC